MDPGPGADPGPEAAPALGAVRKPGDPDTVVTTPGELDAVAPESAGPEVVTVKPGDPDAAVAARPAGGAADPAASAASAASDSKDSQPSVDSPDADDSRSGADREGRPEAAPEAAPTNGDGDGDGDRDGAAARLNGATALGGAESPVTQDFPPPEGAGRAASGDAPAPARQWPLISVLALAALGLLTVGVHPFEAAFRVGTIMVGVALVGGSVLRRSVPSVGMLAVRSRFTDMVTYGVLGVAIVLFALMIQPRPWVDIPFLQSVVHSSVP
ncbi:DUF3017 domain-containing protein [Streptomyces sp. NBC_01497]|uniref:DUF3017 domain-containing protein n=1 Tax=Streptomyces sp. NBC_01497 TaxID=2903885 RepID=UPI002E35A330|nr:DUF3017 domain-containing protein [Streptomyces sp. NBC_01497]